MKFYFLVIVSCCINFCALANENIVVKVTVPSLLSDEVGVVIENKAEFPYSLLSTFVYECSNGTNYMVLLERNDI